MGEGQSSAGKMIQKCLTSVKKAETKARKAARKKNPGGVEMADLPGPAEAVLHRRKGSQPRRQETGRGAPGAGGAAYQGACNPAEDPCRPRRGAGDHTTKLMDTRWSTAANEGDPRQDGQQRGAESCSPGAVPEVRLFLLLHPSTKTWTWPAGQEVGHQELWGGDA